MDSLEINRLIQLALLWIAYFVLHSIAASLPLKHKIARRWPHAIPYYRLTFNLQSVILIIPPLYFMYGYDYTSLWQWQGVLGWIAKGLAVLSIIGVFWSNRYYDSSEFLGLKQLREHTTSVEDQEQFHISPLHRFVRHPWYSLGLVLIWTHNMNTAFFLTAVMATLYLVIGSIFEENKLVVYHGERYREYKKRVPGLIPRPWRYLTTGQAQTLLDKSPHPAK